MKALRGAGGETAPPETNPAARRIYGWDLTRTLEGPGMAGVM